VSVGCSIDVALVGDPDRVVLLGAILDLEYQN
jgi:hypothetical protein